MALATFVQVRIDLAVSILVQVGATALAHYETGSQNECAWRQRRVGHAFA